MDLLCILIMKFFYLVPNFTLWSDTDECHRWFFILAELHKHK